VQPLRKKESGAFQSSKKMTKNDCQGFGEWIHSIQPNFAVKESKEFDGTYVEMEY
jgi:hypothetical protein